MIELLEKFFGGLVHAEGVIFIILGIVLFAYKVPRSAEYAPYRVSKNLLAISLWIISINVIIWIYLMDDDWTTKSPRIACMDIIFYYLLGITFSLAITNLLDKKCITRRRLTTTAITWTATTIICLLSQIEGLKEYQDWFLTAGLLGLLEFCARALIYFRKTYARSGEIFDNYFSEDKRHFISWIKRSFYLLYGSAIVAILTINTGIFANWALIVYIICTIMYVSISFINYARDYATISTADTEDVVEYVKKAKKVNIEEAEAKKEKKKQEDFTSDSEKTGSETKEKKILPSHFSEKLSPVLQDWIDTKRYITEQFSIDDLANKLGTNKFYLSTYIRENYDMNFSTWVASLRIQEAKRLMQENPDMRLEAVAYAVGFSSLSYFSKVFSRLEGTSPSIWLRNR